MTFALEKIIEKKTVINELMLYFIITANFS